MSLTSEEIIACNKFFRDRQITVGHILEDSLFADLMKTLKRSPGDEARKRIQDKVLYAPNITPLEFTVAVSSALWREEMDRKAKIECVEFDPDADSLDEVSTRYLTPKEITKLQGVYTEHKLATRGITTSAITDVCNVLYEKSTPDLVHSVLTMMPAKVTLHRFLQTSSSIREMCVNTYRQSMGVDDKELRSVVVHQAHRRVSQLNPTVVIAKDDDTKPADFLSPVSKGQANDTEDYRREFGLTSRNVLQEIADHVNDILSYEDCILAKKLYDDVGLQYGTHLQAVRVKALFMKMGLEVSDNGVRTVSYLLNAVRHIHIRDFVFMLAEMLRQDGPRLQEQKSSDYTKSMGVDEDDYRNTLKFNTREEMRERKKNHAQARRPSIGDVLTKVVLSSKVDLQNSVEDFRHEFGVYEEPEELLDVCHGMLQVVDLVETKKFYYNNGLHNNNKNFNNTGAVHALCEMIEKRSPHKLSPPTVDDYANLTAIWRDKFLTLSFFEFVTTLSSYLRARQASADAASIDATLESIKAFKKALGQDYSPEEAAAIMTFQRNRTERGCSILGQKAADFSSSGQNKYTRRGSLAKNASEYFRVLGVTADEEDEQLAETTHGILQAQDVHKLKARILEGDFTPWKVCHMLAEIERPISEEAQRALCAVLVAQSQPIGLKDAIAAIASHLSEDKSYTLRKEIEAYKASMGMGPEESPGVPAFVESPQPLILSPVKSGTPNDVDEYRREFGVTTADVCHFLSKQCHGELRVSQVVQLKEYFTANVDEKNITEAAIRGGLAAVGRTLSEGEVAEFVARCSPSKRVVFEDFCRMMSLQLMKETHRRLARQLDEIAVLSPTKGIPFADPTTDEVSELDTLLLQCGGHFSLEELQEALRLYKNLHMGTIEDRWHLVNFLSGIKRYCTDDSIDYLVSQRVAFSKFPQLMLAISNQLTKEERAFREKQRARLEREERGAQEGGSSERAPQGS